MQRGTEEERVNGSLVALVTWVPHQTLLHSSQLLCNLRGGGGGGANLMATLTHVRIAQKCHDRLSLSNLSVDLPSECLARQKPHQHQPRGSSSYQPPKPESGGKGTAYTHTHRYVHTCIHAHTHTHRYVYTHTHTDTCTHTHACAPEVHSVTASSSS